VVGGALHNAARVTRARVRGQTTSPMFLGAIVACAIVAVLGQPLLNEDVSVGVTWVRVLGLAVLVASTVFTLWARLSLCAMWSVAPRVGGDGRLRTRGPYAVTRHPIYSGLLGMLLGTTLLGGMGRWIVVVAVGLILFEVKIHMEGGVAAGDLPR
jgi:protein-S-isoprenylcysteine O-methyltransferase Ste14